MVIAQKSASDQAWATQSASKEAETDSQMAYNLAMTLAKAFQSNEVATVTKAAIGLECPILDN